MRKSKATPKLRRRNPPKFVALIHALENTSEGLDTIIMSAKRGGKGDLCDCSTVCAHEARLPPSPGIVLDPLDEIQNERNGEDVVIGMSEPYLSGRTVLP